MLRRSLIAALCAACLTIPMAHAATEGEQYVALDQPIPNAQGTIIKLWAYGCPFCFKFDEAFDPKVMPRIEGEAHLTLVPVHIEAKGKHGRLASQILAGLWLEDKKQGSSVNDPESLYARAKHAWYEAYHRQGQRWMGGSDGFVKTASKATGIDGKALIDKASLPEAIQLADQWRGLIEVAKIQGIPGYVVDGRYLILTKSIRGTDSFVDLVKELHEKDR